MARPTKDGMDYFPLDTNLDTKFQLIEAKHGLTGFAIIIKLLQKVYGENGYFYPWSEKEKLLFCKDVNSEITLVNSVITTALEYKMFDKTVFDRISVLTSTGIQKRYFCALKKKKSFKIYSDVMLIKPEFSEDVKLSILSYSGNNDAITGVFTGNNPTSNGVSTGNNTEKKKEIGNSEIGNVENGNKNNATPENPAQAFSVSQNGSVSSFSGSERIEAARKIWNDAGCIPPCQRSVLNFSPDILSECIRTINSFSDEAIEEAIRNYSTITSSSAHEVGMPYGSFHGFLKGGVDKFISASKPFERFKKQAVNQGSKKQLVTDLSDVPDTF